jgi:hypothetical protein
MAFDQITRSRLQRFVNEARRVLEEEFTRQLQNDFGMDPNAGSVAELASLRHINDAQRESARILRDTLAHYCAGGDMDARQGLDRIVREQAFTVLNRLSALRMAEARGLLVESVGNGIQAKGFQLYARLVGTGLGETGDAFRTYLFSVFDELSQDLPGLFDRYSPQGRLFPREAALLEVLNLINDADIGPLWSEDETIGWIYQYFNSKEERKAMRDASQAPRNSRELAVRNQFFTPRYVVEFLVDNTLGRLWFNATSGDTHLRDRCQYLLVKPDETPQAATKLRDPRTLKLLDPACGSMHFGLYAFDLFVEIYREAWAWELLHGPGSLDVSTQPLAALEPLSQTYDGETAFLRDVPRLIIEHNIYGVDIDPRAAQIASLALWLRAQRAWHDAGVKGKERPTIGQGNIVAAVAPPAERELRLQCAARLDQRDAELFEKTLQLLKKLPELGVLMQVERELPRLIRQVYVGNGSGLFAQHEEESWLQAESRLRLALTEFAHAARSTYQGRLFAQDALQGLRLIDLCREVFDVVVMNPPFGDTSPSTEEYLREYFPSTKNNLYSAFVQRAVELCRSGFIGLISPRTFVVYRDFEAYRREYLLSSECHVSCMADLGWDVLDGAQVETAAYVLSRETPDPEAREDSFGPFFRLLTEPVESKGTALSHCCRAFPASGSTYYSTKSQLSALPGAPLAYWASKSLVDLFSNSPTLEPTFAYCGRGAAAHVFFFRLSWEIPSGSEASERWKRLAHGGEYSPFFRENSLLIDWEGNGRKVKEYILKQYPYLNGNYGWAIQDEDKYGLLGLTSGKRNERFNVQLMPINHIFTNEGQGFIPNEDADVWFLLGYLNSSLVSYFLALSSGLQKTWVYIRPVPVISLSFDSRSQIEKLAKKGYMIKRFWTFGAEESALFSAPWRMHDESAISLKDLVSHLIELHVGDSKVLNEIRSSISAIVLEACALSEGDLAAIHADFERHPSDVAFSPWRGLEDQEIATDVALRIFSYLVGAAFGRWDIRHGAPSRRTVEDHNAMVSVPPLQPGRLSSPPTDGFPSIPPHGLLVEAPGHALDIEARTQIVMRTIWPQSYERIEEELCLAVKARSLREWVKKPTGFFSDHLDRYSKNRRQAPVFWPLSTTSGSYTIWMHYPALTSQTVYIAINDFIEPKLKQVSADVTALRTKGISRTRDDEKQFESLQTFELELIELRDTLLDLAPTYNPNQNDGVQITAAPLWPLFRHKPWQKVLKDTWAKLEAGESDWAHLAMNYWPDRVREKCKTDKSLAIAHGLEHLYLEPEVQPKKARGRKKAGGDA